MKKEEEIRKEIKRIIEYYRHVLDCTAANMYSNPIRALMQIEATHELKALYWTLEEKRPIFESDKQED